MGATLNFKIPNAIDSEILMSPPILPLLNSCKTLKQLTQVHTHIIRRGFEQDHFLIAQVITLLSTFTPNNNLCYQTNIFNRVINPNIYLWNILMKTHCEMSTVKDCFGVLNKMFKFSNSVVPDKFTFPSLIKVCANNLGLREGMIVHGVVLRYGIDMDVFVGSSLVDFYGKCGEIECARKVFDEMPVRNEVSWTSIMVGYLSCGDLFSAKTLFDEMPKRNEATWNAMIKGLIKLGDLKSAREFLDVMPYRNEVSFTTMIDGYAKIGDMVAARALFDNSDRKDLVSWSALISGYVQNGEPGEALNVFNEMWGKNVRPDEFIMVSLMSACSQLGSLERSKWIEDYLVNCSFDLNRAHISSARVNMNAKCGNMEKATLLFESMAKRDLISYCSMIHGLSIHGRGAEATRMFDRMISEGIRPDDAAFTVILTACTRSSLVDDGCRYFDLMVQEYSICPSPDHYACMVNLLGRSGKLKAAYELMRSQPVVTHAGAWGALLGACWLHCDIELGEEVASRLFELEPQNAGNYVLLSNIYAAANRWLDVSRLREIMGDKGVRKIPGCSSVESGIAS